MIAGGRRSIDDGIDNVDDTHIYIYIYLYRAPPFFFEIPPPVSPRPFFVAALPPPRALRQQQLAQRRAESWIRPGLVGRELRCRGRSGTGTLSPPLEVKASREVRAEFVARGEVVDSRHPNSTSSIVFHKFPQVLWGLVETGAASSSPLGTCRSRLGDPAE